MIQDMGWKKVRFQQKKFFHISSLGEKLNARMVDFLVAILMGLGTYNDRKK